MKRTRTQLILLVVFQLTFATAWSFHRPSNILARPLKAQRPRFTRSLCRISAAKVTGLESTPNPSSFLIRLSEPLEGLESLVGTLRGKTFASRSSENGTPKDVASILRVDGIESICAMDKVLTINKKPSTKWEAILPLVMKSLVGSDVENKEIQDMLMLQGLLLTGGTGTATNAKMATSGQIQMRIQMSNKIPIQIEGTGSLGTIQRMKLPPKFVEYMELMKNRGNVDFFKGRKWMDRGVRYLADDDDPDTNNDTSSYAIPEEEKEILELQSALQAEVEEVDAAYPRHRLDRIVSEVLDETDEGSEKNADSARESEKKDALESSSRQQLDLEAVDRYCDLAEAGDLEALKVLMNFVKSHRGLVSARRNALAFLGGTAAIDSINGKKVEEGGENIAIDSMVFDAVASALQNENSPIMRRTAGDAMSDLGDNRAVPFAVSALENDRSKLVQWRAVRILGELADSLEIVAFLKEASFSKDKYAFEVSFEIKDALRKVKARATQQDNFDAPVPKTGPIWKQIQDGTLPSS